MRCSPSVLSLIPRCLALTQRVECRPPFDLQILASDLRTNALAGDREEFHLFVIVFPGAIVEQTRDGEHFSRHIQ